MPEPAQGCLKAVILNILVIVVIWGFWCFLFGPKGILIGIAQYFVMWFIGFFHDAFAPRPKD